MRNVCKFVGLLVMVALFTEARVLAQDASQSPVGTWRLIVQIGNDDPTQELLSFSRDGRVLTAYTGIEEAPGSPRWGEWRRSAGGYDYTSYTILDQKPDAGLLRARCKLQLRSHGTEMQAHCVAELVDGEGNVTANLAEFPITAKRLPIVPID